MLEINKNLRRGVWNIGHIAKVYPGADGCVRAVDVQLPNGILRLDSGEDVPTNPILTADRKLDS